ncbi:T9SS type A sorting domain-containing protein [Flavitalea sp.]|nr:T9SS type A sorting domain-containing protein [Flavitalea sp.]
MKPFQNIILATIAFAIGNNLQAQVDLQNTGVLYVSGASDLIYINGSLTNAAGAALTNNGSLYVNRNITNGQVTMAAGAGTLYLNGSIQQQISGTQVFRTNNLVTNNAAGVRLNNDLSVAAVHTFSSGIVSTSATPNYLIYEAGSSYTGDGDSRHVNGWVRKSGTTAFSFPVGNGTIERKIGASNISSATVFNTRYMGATTNTTNVTSPLFIVDPNEFWQINKLSGGSANVNMNWDDTKVNMPNYGIADIRVANYISGNWTQVGGAASGSTGSTGAISSNLISSFGAFTFGSIAFILPLHLLNFSAVKNNGIVLLKWNTTDEVNVSHHEPQRSDDGLLFTRIGSVTARNIQGIDAYEFSDAKPLTGTTYYRLRSVDKDGRSTLSKVINVSGDATISAELAIVNPAFKSIYGFTNNLSGTFQYQLNTLSGQTVQQGMVDINVSGLNIPLSGSVNKGIYLLSLQKPGFNMVRKVMVGN